MPSFVKCRRGQTAVEYSMIVFLFSFAVVAWLPAPADMLRVLFLDISAQAKTHTAAENIAHGCVRDDSRHCGHTD